MKIAGRAPGGRATKVVTIERPDGPLTLKIQALPLGFLEGTVLERVPSPTVHRKYAMKGGKVLRDEIGRHVLEDQTDDPAYRSAVRRCSTLQGVAMIHEALRSDATVAWDTPQSEDWAAFYGGVYDELVAAGVTTGEMRTLVDEILIISSMKQKDIEATRDSFLPQE